MYLLASVSSYLENDHVFAINNNIIQIFCNTFLNPFSEN